MKPVRDELIKGKDALSQWVQNTLPDKFFLPIDDIAVVTVYKQLIKWAADCGSYKTGVVSKFADGADAWLIASAAVSKCRLVTYEVSSGAKTIVKIPDAAHQVGVECIAPYSMMRELKVVLVLQ
ncbi:MAG: DUF4411 family protein [Pirellulales bacterium]|nr:DUF4411 family protein [Pirellulales bacterium]